MFAGTELLVGWVVQNTVGFLFKEVLVKLAKEAASDAFKDYLKDFFKGNFGEIQDLGKLTALSIVYVRANKLFVQNFQEQLKKNNIDDSEIQERYIVAIDKFIHDSLVRKALGQTLRSRLGIPSSEVSENIASILTKRWNRINYNHRLPGEFNWQEVAHNYDEQISTVLADSDKLRPGFDSNNVAAILSEIRQNSPVAPKFDFKSYKSNLLTFHSNLKLDTLATESCEYILKLSNIFEPQNLGYYRNKPQIKVNSIFDSFTIFDIFNGQQNFRNTVILGNPGSGKSTLTQYMAVDWAMNPIESLPDLELPLLIELRNYVGYASLTALFLKKVLLTDIGDRITATNAKI